MHFNVSYQTLLLMENMFNLGKNAMEVVFHVPWATYIVNF